MSLDVKMIEFDRDLCILESLLKFVHFLKDSGPIAKKDTFRIVKFLV